MEDGVNEDDARNSQPAGRDSFTGVTFSKERRSYYAYVVRPRSGMQSSMYRAPNGRWTCKGGGLQTYVGRFKSALEAAQAFDFAALYIRGSTEGLNFPDVDYCNNRVWRALEGRGLSHEEFVAALREELREEKERGRVGGEDAAVAGPAPAAPASVDGSLGLALHPAGAASWEAAAVAAAHPWPTLAEVNPAWPQQRATGPPLGPILDPPFTPPQARAKPQLQGPSTASLAVPPKESLPGGVLGVLSHPEGRPQPQPAPAEPAGRRSQLYSEFERASCDGFDGPDWSLASFRLSDAQKSDPATLVRTCARCLEDLNASLVSGLPPTVLIDGIPRDAFVEAFGRGCRAILGVRSEAGKGALLQKLVDQIPEPVYGGPSAQCGASLQGLTRRRGAEGWFDWQVWLVGALTRCADFLEARGLWTGSGGRRQAQLSVDKV